MLFGGAGQDTLNGGLGNDTFVYSLVSESLPGPGNRDLILNFDPGAGGDVIDLSGIDANVNNAGDNAFTDPQLDYNPVAGILNVDVRGIGADGSPATNPDMEIKLVPPSRWTCAEFVFFVCPIFRDNDRFDSDIGSNPSMHLSIIIPAFNEELLIEECLKSVHASLDANAKPGFTSEIIMVDNNSTDNTAELARKAGARVVFEPVNQIGRARNTGAAVATGDWLLFVDADSILNPGLLGDILRLIEEGRIVGCGSAIKMQDLPWWASGVLRLWTATSVLFRWAAGALVVSRADAFRDVGGFDQELYAADEITLSENLKKWGRTRGLQFPILTKHPLESSPRKVQLYSAGEIFGQIARVMLSPRRSLQDKKHLSVWYDGRR